MRFRFLHCADVHLGKHEKSGGERYLDYFAALSAVIDHAITQKVDAVIAAGDFFDTQEPSADTLLRAARELRPLRAAGIPLYTIEGNHDRKKRGEAACALDVLAGEGYFHLLRPEVTEGGMRLPPYKPGEGGCVVEAHEGVRITGLGFLGHRAEDRLRETAACVDSTRANIILAHTMMQLDEARLDYGTCLFTDVADLGDSVAYLALGHRHTRTGLHDTFGGWIYNPGSLEFVSVFDYRQSQDTRGFFDVTISAAGGAAAAPESSTYDPGGTCVVTQNGSFQLHVRHRPTRKRPAHVVPLDVTGIADAGLFGGHAVETVFRALDKKTLAERPIIILRLEGRLAIPRVMLPRNAMVTALREASGAAHVDVLDGDLFGENAGNRILSEVAQLDDVHDRALAIVEDLVCGNGILPSMQAEFSSALLDVKQLLSDAAESPSQEKLRDAQSRLAPFIPKAADIT